MSLRPCAFCQKPHKHGKYCSYRCYHIHTRKLFRDMLKLIDLDARVEPAAPIDREFPPPNWNR